MKTNVHRLPDLARMRAISERVRSSSDEDVADLLCTEDGQWFFVECGPVMPSDVLRRVVEIVTSVLPDGAVFGTLAADSGQAPPLLPPSPQTPLFARICDLGSVAFDIESALRNAGWSRSKVRTAMREVHDAQRGIGDLYCRGEIAEVERRIDAGERALEVVREALSGTADADDAPAVH